MVQIATTEQAIQHTLTDGESFSVPSGEVYKLTVLISGNSQETGSTSVQMEINGFPVAEVDSNDTSGCYDFIATGGDTISCQTSDASTEQGIHVSGFRVDQTVGNSVSTQLLGDEEGFTVPTGTYRYTALMPGNSNAESSSTAFLEIDGHDVFSQEASRPMASQPVFIATGGTSIRCEVNSTEQHIWISGFRVDQ